MKFRIYQANYYPTLNDIIQNYPILNNYKLDEKQDEYKNIKPYIYINSVKQLIDLSKQLRHPLIVNAEREIPEIEIYDGWRE
nr:MAG TPA: hypothetical protein [Bacteriophage sp.]